MATIVGKKQLGDVNKGDLKAQVIEKLISLGNNPDEVKKMVEQEFEYVSKKYTGVSKIAEVISSLYEQSDNAKLVVKKKQVSDAAGKYKVGDEVYTWQNPNFKCKIVKVLSGSEPSYIVDLPDPDNEGKFIKSKPVKESEVDMKPIKDSTTTKGTIAKKKVQDAGGPVSISIQEKDGMIVMELTGPQCQMMAEFIKKKFSKEVEEVAPISGGVAVYFDPKKVNKSKLNAIKTEIENNSSITANFMDSKNI
jgi:hypothetical protein